MKSKKLIVLLILSGISAMMFATDISYWQKEKEKAENLYNKGNYDEAVILFREIILSSGEEKLKVESYFWLAKAYMSIDKLEQASVNIEHYLKNYKTAGLNYPEAVYQKGRLLFLQEQYQDAVEQLNSFIESYAGNELVSNAYYWIGECLYALGRFDDAALNFNIVINNYPTAIKQEASRYKLRLIEHKKSELALQNLLKWSQEQYLSALNQFRIREKSLEQAIEEYKKQKEKGLTPADMENMNKLRSENEQLKEKINSLEKQILQITQSLTDKELLEKLKQLELKNSLLESKEEALKIFEEQLRQKEEVLE